MGVYRPAKSRFFHYDFVLKGRRFHGSTGQDTRRAAEAVERRYRQEAAEGRLGSADQLTLDQACGKWWKEVGQHGKDQRNQERRVAGLLTLFGKNTLICDITTRAVAEAMERRRATPYLRQADGVERFPGPSTINRDVIIPLRSILNRARRVWEAKGMPEINWEGLTLAQPGPAIRWYTDAQQERWRAEAEKSDPGVELAVRMLLRYGMRFHELFFPLEAFDPDGPRLFLPGSSRKKDVIHILPLRRDDGRELAARIGRARAAGLTTAFFTEDEDGDLVEMTYHGLYARIRRAAANAQLPGKRLIHGARHHAGTTLLRETDNLRLTQQLLGHADIKSTTVYAHALEDDLRDALEGRQSRNSPGPGIARRKKA